MHCFSATSMSAYSVVNNRRQSKSYEVPYNLVCTSHCVPEHMSTYGFLQPDSEPLPPSLASTPVRYMTHTVLIAGSRVTVPGVDPRQQSGYQVLRLATELVPSTLALLGADIISPFWAVLFYFVLILFGIAQQVCVTVTCCHVQKYQLYLQTCFLFMSSIIYYLNHFPGMLTSDRLYVLCHVSITTWTYLFNSTISCTVLDTAAKWSFQDMLKS
jgi:hypothetical protein